MMAAAKEMMNDKAWQTQMKKLQNDKGFKESIKKTSEMLQDPAKAAQAEAKMEHMVKVGNDQLKQGAAAAMEQAMEAMHNPEVMAEMAALVKDPSFKQQLEALSKDPSFQSYIEAMQDMMNDRTLIFLFFNWRDSFDMSVSMKTTCCKYNLLMNFTHTLFFAFSYIYIYTSATKKRKIEEMGDSIRASL
jgi:hypothetical protein